MLNRIHLASKIIFIILVGLAVVVASGWSFLRPQKTTDLSIRNQTSALKVVEAKKENEAKNGISFATVKVINVSDKGVVAYTFLNPLDQSTLTSDGATSGWVLQPGQTDSIRTRISTNENLLILSAVLLEDGTGEGDETTVNRLREHRIGVDIQLQRIANLLRQHLDSFTASHRTVSAQTLLEDNEQLPDQFDQLNIPGSRREGMRQAKLDFAYEIKRLGQEISAEQVSGLLSKVDNARSSIQRSIVNPSLYKEEK